jgi:uncharacterized protein DUF4129
VILPSVIDAVGGPPITRDGARADANRELTKAIYHRYDDPWPVRVFNAVQHLIQRLFDEVGKHAPGGGAGAASILVALAVLLVLLRWRLGPIGRTARLSRPVLENTRTTASDYRLEAASAAADGRWAEAIVARMRALAHGLEESGAIPERAGRTADELATEVAPDRPDAAALVRRAARVFDEVAYGGRAGTSAGYSDVAEADHVLSLLPSRR